MKNRIKKLSPRELAWLQEQSILIAQKHGVRAILVEITNIKNICPAAPGWTFGLISPEGEQYAYRIESKLKTLL